MVQARISERSHPLASEESSSLQIFCPPMIFINNFQLPNSIMMIFLGMNLYIIGKLCIKCEACRSNRFGVIINGRILRGIAHLYAAM